MDGFGGTNPLYYVGYRTVRKNKKSGEVIASIYRTYNRYKSTHPQAESSFCQHPPPPLEVGLVARPSLESPKAAAIMCGIYCSLSVQQPLLPDEKTRSWLRRRGPDSLQTHHVQVTCGRDPDKVPGYLTVVSTVLALRGDHVQTQPLVDSKSQSILCWNGEAWKISDWPVEGNDTEQIFRGFIDASQKADADEALRDLTRFISSISGPFAFVFYDGCHSRLFYSRDYIGRRSLLHGQDEYGNLKICSVSDGKTDTMFEEVETTGLHMIDLAQTAVDDIHQNKRMVSKVSVIPWSGSSLTETIHFLVCSLGSYCQFSTDI